MPHASGTVGALMTDQPKPPPTSDPKPPAYAGPERRSGLDRRQDPNPQPPPGVGERRKGLRRGVDRHFLDRVGRADSSDATERLYQRVHVEVPVFYRPFQEVAAPPRDSRRGLTCTLAPGGLGMLLDEELPVGTVMEVLVRFERDLLAADVQVVSVTPQASQFRHNCRFTRLGAADRNWLNEYLRIRDRPPA